METRSPLPRPVAVPWTDQHDAYLKSAGLPAAVLARDISRRFGVDRSEAAVRSRAALIGLDLPRSLAGDIGRSITNRPPPAPARPEMQFRAPLRPTGDTALRLIDLEDGACRFPVGQATGLEQLYCARPAEAGKSYCRRCRARAYQPQSSMTEDERKAFLKLADCA